MNGDENNDWRFNSFRDTSGAYNRTLAIDAPFSRANFQNQYGGGNVTAASRSASPSRIIPSPSNTNWNSTFANNQPSSPSRTDWQKTFGGGNSFVSSPSPAATRPLDEPRRSLGVGGSAFQFSLSPATDRTGLSLSSSPAPDVRPPASDFFQSRLTDADITSRDHQLYGASPDLGFTY